MRLHVYVNQSSSEGWSKAYTDADSVSYSHGESFGTSTGLTVCQCFEYIRDRNKNEDDSYTLYITENEILKNGYIVLGYKNDGVFIEFNQEDCKISPTKNLYI